jgi:acyl carrier protein
MATTGARPRPRWLLRWPGADAKALLFCLPYAGSGASVYHRWPRTIGDVEICPVQFPGREDRLHDPHYGGYRELARQAAEGLETVLDRPFAFFGPCDSALIGLEIAAYLSDRGGPVPVGVFASSMVSPDRTDFAPVLRLDDDGLLGLLGDMAKARGGAIEPELAAMALSVMRADIEAFRGYVPGEPERYRCPVTVIGWQDDDMIPAEETRDWQPYGQTRRVVLPGGHWSFLEAPTELREILGATGSVVAPWPAVFEETLRAHLPELAPDVALRPDDQLRDLGLDSFGTVELLVSLENAFEVMLPDDALTEETFFTAGTLWTVLSGLLTLSVPQS